MLYDWQTLTAGVLVLLAAGYLLRRSWRRLRGIGGQQCPNCTGCASAELRGSAADKQFVPLDVERRDA